MAMLKRWWHVEGGVAIEKACRFEVEADALYRHNRPVFGAHDMVGAEGVPDNQVGLLQRAVLLDVGRQAIAARLLIRVVTGGVALRRVVGRYPEMGAREAAALPLRRACGKERKDIFLRHQLVSDGLAQSVERGRVDDFPVARGARLYRALSFGLAGQQRLPRDPGVAARIFRSPGQRLAV